MDVIHHSEFRPPNLARLVRALKRHGITQARVAAEASKTAKFGTTSCPVVSSVLSGQYKSKNVIAAAKRLLAEAKKNGGSRGAAFFAEKPMRIAADGSPTGRAAS